MTLLHLVPQPTDPGSVGELRARLNLIDAHLTADHARQVLLAQLEHDRSQLDQAIEDERRRLEGRQAA